MKPGHSAREYADSADLLGHELRVEILLALGIGKMDSSNRPSIVKMPYADLMDAVQAQDSGRFNYHLNELRGSLVMKQDGEYMLTPHGLAAVGTIIGTDRDQHRDLGEVDFNCPLCDATISAAYDSGAVVFQCQDDTEDPSLDGSHRFSVLVPTPGATSRSREEILQLARSKARQNIKLTTQGICPSCRGRFEWLETPATLGADQLRSYRGECEVCGYVRMTSPGVLALTDPAVISFFQQQGINVYQRFMWNIGYLPADQRQLVAENQSGLVRVTYRVGCDSLTAVLDETGSVITT